jgi:hypothetical protein
MDPRHTLASAICGHALPARLSEDEVDAWRRLAQEEGVTALLADRLVGVAPDESEGGVRAELASQGRRLAMMELGQHAALVAVLDRLRAAAIPVLVLKAAALRCWLYPQPHLRESSDIDLLFATREAAMAAVAALQAMGYAAPYPPGRFAHEVLCRHAGKRVDLDLHWGLSRNPAMDALPAFHALHARAQPLPGLGPEALGLGPVDALLHACVHRASNLETGQGDRLKWLYDTHLIAARLDGDGWEAFVAACRTARVCGIAADALEVASALFGTGLPRSAMARLREGVPHDALDARRLQDWAYLQRRSLRALPGWSARAAWLWERAFPDTGYMRELYGRDLSRAGLLRTRLSRLLGRLGQT